MADKRVFVHRVDGRDMIASVNPEWLAFAAENGAPELVRPGVVGKPLWEFIADPETQYLYALILRKVRRTSAVICFAYRCDSPQVRRQMEMVVRAWTGNGAEFSSRLVREEPRDPVALLAPTAARSDRLITMCGWCKRIATPEWLEVEQAVQRLHLFEHQHVPQITQAVCANCRERARAMVEEAGRG